ncbi:MAG: hypothetical protein U9N04_04390 [Patescibacteria group bacterium]|nr:hypothetical protein [Patescibacteria group bacterium]
MKIKTEDLIEAIKKMGGKVINQKEKILTINGVIIEKDGDGKYISNLREHFRCVYPEKYGYKILVPTVFLNRITSRIILIPV